MQNQKRDAKGRILREGERQRPDGRYEYRCRTPKGNVISLYSWRLVATDATPQGKRKCVPLREQELSLNQDLEAELDAYTATSLTVDEAYKKWMRGKVKIRESTKISYESNYNTHIKDAFGLKKVKSIKTSHVRQFYIDLQTKKGISHGTVQISHTILMQVFDMLVQDDILRKNPARGALRDTEINPCKKRHCLTVQDQTRFLEFARRDTCAKKWFPLLVFLFGTGVRIGEAAAITWQDIDFGSRTIHVTKTLTKTDGDPVVSYYKVGTPKTEAGTRTIPMLSAVEQVLLELYQKETYRKSYESIASSVVFKNVKGNRISPEGFNSVLRETRDRFNRLNDVPIPCITPHVIRHTFCVRLCEKDVNIKVVQAVMGHSDITVTMDIYNEATEDRKRQALEEFDKMNAAAIPKFVPTFVPISTSQI